MAFIEDIKIRLGHNISIDKESIHRIISPLQHLFDETIIKQSRGQLKNEEREISLLITRNFLEFEMKSWKEIEIVEKCLHYLNDFKNEGYDQFRLELNDPRVSMSITPVLSKSFDNFNQLIRNVPNGVSTEFVGFRYSSDENDYYITLLTNKDKLNCKIVTKLNEREVNKIPSAISELHYLVETKIYNVIKEYLGGER